MRRKPRFHFSHCVIRCRAAPALDEAEQIDDTLWLAVFLKLFGTNPRAAAIGKFKQKMAAQATARRKFLLLAAARAFELDQGRPPASTEELVPDYLSVAPKDAVSGATLPLPPAP